MSPLTRSRLLWRGQRGTTAVEFALIAVAFFLIVTGVFDLGRAMFYYNMLSNAAREGARAGIVAASAGRLSRDQICSVAGEATKFPAVSYPVDGCGSFDSLAVNVPPSDYGTPGDPDDPLVVSLSYTFEPLTPMIGALLPDGQITMSAASSMYVEQ